MGFVNYQEGERQLADGSQHAVRHQSFWREVEQIDLSGRDTAPDIDILRPVFRRVDGLGSHAGQFQGGDLILHQGNEG